MMKKTFSIIFSLLFSVFVASSFAVDLSLYGPEAHVLDSKKQYRYTTTFNSMAEQAGYITGNLLVWNGEPDGSHQVKKAHIWVNGRLVFKPIYLKKKGDVIRIPLPNLKTENTLKIKIKGNRGSYLTIQVAETGPTGPIFSGPHQYPFVCRTEQSNLGQPLVDNFDGYGIPVLVEDGSGNQTEEVAGYCKDCSMVTRVDYFYRSTNGNFYPLDDPADRPDDLAEATSNGLTVPYIVRLERGTINRFIYGIALLWPIDEEGNLIEAWNRKLLYRFSGGVAIGHDQGTLSWGSPLYHDALSRGYAVCYSTGNRTGVHYNLQLAGETAIMVKDHFVNRFGDPEYTISVGGSGGAIQQYVFGQNHPGLLDGIIPQASYSDMITQSIYVGDCMLLEYYFDVIAPMQGDFTFGGFAFNPSAVPPVQNIGSILPRTWIEGLSSSDTVGHPIYSPMTGQSGSTECVNGWLGLTPLAMNPLFTDVDDLDQFPDDVVLAVKWTHWDDLKNIYGTDEEGYAPSTWDNEGVQYGLQALRDGKISLAQFLDINAKAGGWKKPFDMVPEGYPFSAWNTIQELVGPPPDPMDLDFWSIRNANVTLNEAGVAPRTAGDIGAMNAAYTSGHVLTGNVDIPTIDMRTYLDPFLDMHHAQQSFATRQRLIEGQGFFDNQLIWFAHPFTAYPGNITVEAMELLDEWLIGGSKPVSARDKCFYEDGTFYAGDDAWDGILDSNSPGPCSTAFPLYATSRIVAGGDIKGDIFKCHRIPVAEAIASGFYDPVVIDGATQDRLEQIFPDGVCDFSLGDMGRPEGW
jgi:hypothetical protein